jgi:hypothetical protein
MKRCMLIIFAMSLALLAGCRGHGLDERDYTDAGVQWGKAVNGLQVGLARRTYEAGKAPGFDQTYFIVTMRNVGKEPLHLLAPVAIGGVIPEKLAGNESVSVKLNYDSAAGLKTASFKPPNKPVVQMMEPGKSYNLEARLTAAKFGLDRFLPGRLTASYSNDQATIKYDAIAEPVSGLWTGEAQSGVVKVEVSEPKVPQKSAAAEGNGGGNAK